MFLHFLLELLLSLVRLNSLELKLQLLTITRITIRVGKSRDFLCLTGEYYEREL